jgi:hypothetical protein
MNKSCVDLTGKKFGKLIVESYAHVGKNNGPYWNCLCECGNKHKVTSNGLKGGKALSCGCSKHFGKTKNIGKECPRWTGHELISGQFFSSIKGSAIKRGIEFSISIEDIWELYLKQNKKCALSGLELKFKSSCKDSRGNTASLDRVDSTKGYTLDNIQLVHKDVNLMKNKFDQSYFVTFCELIVDHCKKQDQLLFSEDKGL